MYNQRICQCHGRTSRVNALVYLKLFDYIAQTLNLVRYGSVCATVETRQSFTRERCTQEPQSVVDVTEKKYALNMDTAVGEKQQLNSVVITRLRGDAQILATQNTKTMERGELGSCLNRSMNFCSILDQSLKGPRWTGETTMAIISREMSDGPHI